MADANRRKVPSIEGYEIYEPLGSGAMGTVFRARHIALDRIVALKIIRRSYSKTKRQIERLRREGKLVASLDHPNIVRGYDLGESGGFYYLSMEFVAGRTLREILKERTLPEGEALDITEKIVAALAHAHTQGVIHRDLKPANVMISWEGEVKLADLGLAKGPENAALTHSGATIGTPQYIAPEQAQDPRRADPRSDYYSLGATLYHMVTGKAPFTGEGIADVIAKVLFSPPPPPQGLVPELSDGMNHLILRMMAKDPSARPAKPEMLLRLLERVRQGETIAPAVDEARTRTKSPFRSGALLGGALTGLLLILVFLASRFLGPDDGGDTTGPDPGAVEVAKSPLELSLEELDRRATPVAFPEGFDLLSEISRLRGENPEAPGERKAEMRRLEQKVSRSFTALLGSVFQEVEEGSRTLVKQGACREALSAFGPGLHESEFARVLGLRVGIGLDGLPDRSLTEVEGRREEGASRTRSRVSQRLSKDLIDGVDRLLIGDGRWADRASRLEEIERRYLGDRDLLTLADDERVGDRIHEKWARLREGWTEEYKGRENEVLDLAESRQFDSARRRLDAIGEDGIFSVIPRLVSRQEDLREELDERDRSAALDEEEAHQEFVADHRELLAAKKYDRAEALTNERLAQLAPASGETDRLGEILAETEAVGHTMDLVQDLWRRVEKHLAGFTNQKKRLSVRGNRNEREILEVKNGTVRYRFTSSGNVSTFPVHAIDLNEIRRMFPVVHATDAATLSVLLLEQARGEADVTRRERDLSKSREELAASRALNEAEAGERTTWLASWFRWMEREIDEVERAVRKEGEEQRRKTLALYQTADRDYEDGRYEEALRGYERLRTERVHRKLYLENRMTVDERAIAARRALDMESLSRRFEGRVTPLGAKNRIRIFYDFADRGQLADWSGGSRRFFVEEDKLRCAPVVGRMTGARFKATVGLQHRATLDLYRGVRLEFDLQSEEGDPGAFFFVVSLYGNHIAVLSRTQEGERRAGQLNTWTGRIEDYEDSFHLVARSLREPRGIVDFALLDGRPQRLAVEVTDHARLIRFTVDGEVVLERELVRPTRSGHVEIRGWSAFGVDNLVLEGVIEE